MEGDYQLRVSGILQQDNTHFQMKQMAGSGTMMQFIIMQLIYMLYQGMDQLIPLLLPVTIIYGRSGAGYRND